jgi:glycerol-3-phosphate acyltransferase PlsY
MAGVITLVFDALKGAAAVVIANWIIGVPISGVYTGPATQLLEVTEFSPAAHWWVAAASVAVIVGHIFPVWLGFRGGKGVATGVGVFLMLSPIAVALAALIFLLIVWRTRYVSLGSIVAAVTIPLFVWFQDAFIRQVGPLIPVMTAAAAGAILIIFAHRANVRRIIEGSESRFK